MTVRKILLSFLEMLDERIDIRLTTLATTENVDPADVETYDEVI